ncbi:IPTL-CTERM sorting domain-containing protein [Thiocapsa sp. UBA6158]|uniref:IPTL-CTERM sorting domain-containing protein n=1 Tax=Thiocapsa sp. UBA6158 TaxID=1947692 RepID=UPI0025DAFFD1|nr:IPTL-CTERM sorting domain-containing protein [Thiocapsa sp. UBA6158]
MRIRLALPLTGLLLAPSFFLSGAVFAADCVPGVASAGTCTVPANVFKVSFEAWGGGGRGGARSVGSGGGGGAGSFCGNLEVPVQPGDDLAITIGAGGNSASGNGGASSVVSGAETLVSAAGGTGVGSSATGGNGGAACTITGAIGYAGGRGGNGATVGGGGGGGGGAGSGSNGSNGGNGTVTAAGVGGEGGTGATPGGAGGQGAGRIVDEAVAGSAPGGGGGGRSTVNNSRADGAAGRVTLAFTVSDPDRELSGITVDGGSDPVNVPADGTTSATIAVTVLDEDENPLSGSVVLSADSATTVITPVELPTTIRSSAPSVGASGTAPLINGVATFTVTNTVVESVTYSAKAYTDPDQPTPANGFAPAAIVTIGDGVIVTFEDLPPPVAIPTMSAYGLLAMTGLLGLLAGWHQRRRRG